MAREFARPRRSRPPGAPVALGLKLGQLQGVRGKGGEASAASRAVLLAMGSSGGWLRVSVSLTMVACDGFPCLRWPVVGPWAPNPAKRDERSRTGAAVSLRSVMAEAGSGQVDQRLRDRRQTETKSKTGGTSGRTALSISIWGPCSPPIHLL